MKKALTTLALLIIVTALQAAGLNSNSVYFRDNYPEDYNETILKQAKIEWKIDAPMIVYKINRQCDALKRLLSYEERYSQPKLFITTLGQWSYEGEANANYEIILDNNCDLTPGVLIKLKCDWTMMIYEFDRQLEALKELE